jgi:Carboxypeptidase regulatory-like domain
MRHTLSIALSVLAFGVAPSFAQAPTVTVTGKSAASTKLLPGTRSSVLSTIEGKALNSVNSPMTETSVRLRDARSGQIVQTTLTDKQGAFIFRELDPGTYVVEIVGPGKTVLASSGLINIGTGEAVSAVVRVPFQTSTLAGLLGNSQSAASAITNAAQVVTAAAAAGNIGAQTLSGAASTSTTTTNGR